MGSIISSYISTALCLTPDERSKLKYSLQVILGDASKLIVLFLFFLCLKVPGQFAMAVLALSILRVYTGGLHFKSYLGCLLFSLLFFCAAIGLADFCELPQPYMYLWWIFSLIVIALISPITSKNRPVYSKQQRFNFKVIGCSVVYFHLIGAIAIKNNPYFEIAMWVIFLQAIQLLIAKGIQCYEKKNPS